MSPLRIAREMKIENTDAGIGAEKEAEIAVIVEIGIAITAGLRNVAVIEIGIETVIETVIGGVTALLIAETGVAETAIEIGTAVIGMALSATVITGVDPRTVETETGTAVEIVETEIVIETTGGVIAPRIAETEVGTGIVRRKSLSLKLPQRPLLGPRSLCVISCWPTLVSPCRKLCRSSTPTTGRWRRV